MLGESPLAPAPATRLFGRFADKLRIGGGGIISVVRDSGEIMARPPLRESSYGVALRERVFLRPDSPVSDNFRQEENGGHARLAAGTGSAAGDPAG